MKVDISKCNIEIKRHAFLRALNRGIHPDFVEATIKGGKVKSFGKNYVKFTKYYKRFDIICVGQIIGNIIKIITIEKKRR